MRAVKHLLSDSAEWMTNSEFVDKDGNILRAIGEAKIVVDDNEIINESWACVEGKKVFNNYRIQRESDSKFSFECTNPEQGTRKGDLNLDRNILYSKFTVSDSSLSGFEIIVKDEDECTVYGTLYDGKELLNSWRTIMVRIS